MAKDKNLDKDIDLKKYNDPSGLSVSEMDFGLWLSENRHKLLRILTIFLIVLSAGLFIFSSYYYVIYLSSGGNTSLVTNNIVSSPRQVTADLLIDPVQVFTGENSYDLAVKLTNPNDKFTANFQYCFTQAGQNLTCGDAYIMPGEVKYVLDLAQVISGTPGDIVFQTSHIFWQRIDAHKIPDWGSYASSHLNFVITNQTFTPAASNSLSNKVGLNTLSFTVQDQSAYGYYQAPLDLLFFNGTTLVGVNRYDLENINSGETRQVNITWPGSLPGVTQTQIVPDINIMDPSVYLPYTGPAAAAY